MPKQLIHPSREIRARLRNIENEYLRFYAAAEEHDRYVRFADNLLPSMYSYNCAVLKEKLSAAEVHEQIGALLAEATEHAARHLYIVLHPNHSFAANPREAEAFEVSSLLYMTVPFDEFRGAKPNASCEVCEATTPALRDDAMICDIADSVMGGEAHVDYGFAYRRAARKRLAFERRAPYLSQYVAYLDGVPVGKCEVSLHGDIVRPESFAVLPAYQRKGIGTAMLDKIVEDGKTRGCKEMFLVTDPNDTAKEMYRKLGFRTVGLEHQLLWIGER